MATNIENRDLIIDALRQELVGPSPQGEELDLSKPVRFTSYEEQFKPYHQAETGEEILQRDPPTRRYGVGVLFPSDTRFEENVAAGAPATDPDDLEDEETATDGQIVTGQAQADLERLGKRAEKRSEESDFDDFDISTANSYQPSSMAISFLAQIPSDSRLVVKVYGGRYESLDVSGVRKRPRADGSTDIRLTWWKRVPVQDSVVVSAGDISEGGDREHFITRSFGEQGALELTVELLSRPHGSDQRLITIALVNRSTVPAKTDEKCLFQAGFSVTIESQTENHHFLPYPGPPHDKLDDEEQSIELLYRQYPNYGIGHGCAANWSVDSESRGVAELVADCLPHVEVPSTTPELFRDDGTQLQISMSELAALCGEVPFESLNEVIELYEHWITERGAEIDQLESKHHRAAVRHLAECRRAAGRMREGFQLLQSDQTVRRAFELANHAILLQQLNTRNESREAKFDQASHHFSFSPTFAPPDPLISAPGRGSWRPFQIAFLLAVLPSVASHDHPDRETVELIWFPTGGGKTEAYLGLSAFSIFLRRLRDPTDKGVEVLMRYTLRLLTAQQFQRAAGLVCAMEYLRKRNMAELGDEEISIGIWLGGDTTPNSRTNAKSVLRDLQKQGQSAQNKFILTRCPWCGAEMGPLDRGGQSSRDSPKVIGYDRRGDTVQLSCPDKLTCEFGNGLPVYVIDEDIYDFRPDVVIGTVDKFARLAWDSRPRALFGISTNGERIVSPPGLILQDELHLISGPLGSLVGLYEAILEELCTDHRQNKPVRPKIVSSTATIRRFSEQIRALYGRDDSVLFPPPALEAGDSFFARYARGPEGKFLPGRIYLGVHAPGLGSMQTAQVRTFAALLQAPNKLTAPERDPWWTLLVFFNSLRELGTSLSLLQSDIPDYLNAMRVRFGIDSKGLRSFWNVKELTGRMRSDEVPQSIAALEVPTTSDLGKPVDVCLASNIIEVGVDIDRLSLLTVVGQPKTTSQYIQVTGRVGRRWWERPGLVVTIYGASKPRDRSHFEQFRTYHERLFAKVEPTSVTPFSPPVLDRALHAALVAYVRQVGKEEDIAIPIPFPEELVFRAAQLLEERLMVVDAAELKNFRQVLRERLDQWKRWQRTEWRTNPMSEDIGLLRPAGEYASQRNQWLSWPTPQSMRNVDAECQAEIVNPPVGIGLDEHVS